MMLVSHMNFHCTPTTLHTSKVHHAPNGRASTDNDKDTDNNHNNNYNNNYNNNHNNYNNHNNNNHNNHNNHNNNNNNNNNNKSMLPSLHIICMLMHSAHAPLMPCSCTLLFHNTLKDMVI